MSYANRERRRYRRWVLRMTRLALQVLDKNLATMNLTREYGHAFTDGWQRDGEKQVKVYK